MRKYLDSNPDKHCALLILLIIGGFGLKMCIYIGAWSPVGVLLLSLIRMGALFEGIIVRSYDAFDDPEPTEEAAQAFKVLLDEMIAGLNKDLKKR